MEMRLSFFFLFFTLFSVQEVSNTLDSIQSSIEQCIPILYGLNQLLEENKLEHFQLYPTDEVDSRSGGGVQVQEGGEEEDGEAQVERDEETNDHLLDVS